MTKLILKRAFFLPFLFSLFTLIFVQPVLAADSITITSPVNYQVIQRNSSNQANITISGTYSGSPTAIEASWNSGAYSTIVSSPTSGTFSGTLSAQSAGQGTLIVRFTNSTSVSTSIIYVGIGDVFIIAGQSNANGYGFNNQVYSHPTIKASLFGKDDIWKNLADPVGDGTNSVDAVTGQLGAGGSVWPPLATILMNNQNVPIAFVPCADSGSLIASWSRNNSNPGDTATRYGSMYRRINAVGNVKAVLWWQGESDFNTNRTTYKTALVQLANNVYSDFGVKLITAQIGDRVGVSGTGLDNIRLAQVSAWNDAGNVLPGPALYDVNLSDESGDGLHFKSNGDIQIAANRWGAAVLKDIYGTGDARGPQLSVAEYDSTKTNVTLTFADDSLPILPASGFSGFTIYDNSTPATISTITKPSSNQLLISLVTAATGTITVSLGEGHTGTGATVPTDSSTYNLPAEIFVNQATTLLNETNSSSSSTSSSASAPVCNNLVPMGTSPYLYSSTSNSSSSITLKFTNWQSPTDHFVLEYGTSPNKYQYGADNIGGKDITSYTVNYLNPNTTYYFRVRAGNGCAVGSWSNEISAKTLGSFFTNNTPVGQSQTFEDIKAKPIENTTIAPQQNPEFPFKFLVLVIALILIISFFLMRPKAV
ncbi:MAG TPA: sialate O-acetylesterase [Alphaproteobacteria bacterium]|jgi:hypothetical protein|nr:sialate O-acetylesterase [Alphaproteobacteria bacterium]